MKKHFYYFVSSITQILLSIYAIINSESIMNDIMSTTSLLPEYMQEEITSISNIYVILIAAISLLINLLILFIIFRKTVTKKKIIALSILNIIFAPLELITYIAIINLILSITIKNDIIDKVEIPSLEIKRDKKYILKAIALTLVYVFQFFIKYLPINTNITGYIFEGILFILSIIAFLDIFKEEIKLFFSNFRSYMKYILPKIGGAYLIYIIVSLISISITKQTTSVNQQALETLNIWYLLFAAVIWAPIVEETIFRRCIRLFIKNDKLFIIVSALIFGLLHTMNESSLLNVIIVGLPYITLGGYLAYIYTKTNNSLSNMFSHMLINTFAVIVMILTSI